MTLRWRRLGASILLFGLAMATPAHAQGFGNPYDPPGGPPDLRRGALLFHGNYCGPGNRPGYPPVDALDAACMRHDRCTPDDGLPVCACNGRLRAEATRVARDPRQPDDLRTLAEAVANGAVLLPCRQGPGETRGFGF